MWEWNRGRLSRCLSWRDHVSPGHVTGDISVHSGNLITVDSAVTRDVKRLIAVIRVVSDRTDFEVYLIYKLHGRKSCRAGR